MILIYATMICISSYFLLKYGKTDEYKNCNKMCKDIDYKNCTVKVGTDNLLKSIIVEYNSTIKEIIYEKESFYYHYHYQINQTIECYFNETSNKLEHIRGCFYNVCTNLANKLIVLNVIFIVPFIILAFNILFFLMDIVRSIIYKLYKYFVHKD